MRRKAEDENPREAGSRYEREAAARLSRMGYRNESAGDPAEAVDGRKRARIIRCAEYFMMKRGFGGDTPCRFDVAAFLRDEAGGEIRFRLIRDAFWT